MNLHFQIIVLVSFLSALRFLICHHSISVLSLQISDVCSFYLIHLSFFNSISRYLPLLKISLCSFIHLIILPFKTSQTERELHFYPPGCPPHYLLFVSRFLHYLISIVNSTTVCIMPRKRGRTPTTDKFRFLVEEAIRFQETGEICVRVWKD